MATIYLYNTLSCEKEEFQPITPGEVGLYTCGPTVYNYAHLGNLRTYIFEDVLKRVLLYNEYRVKHVMNITDVGHLTGDRDMGTDKIEKEAKAEHKSAWDIAKFYTDAFERDIALLGILEPDIWSRATDHISDQINLIKILEDKGYTYKTSDGIYFDTSKVRDYNKLSHQPLEELKEGARVEKNDEKRNPTDFALWKFSPSESTSGERRQMEWDSPWGVGFPGWHIECSAMSLKYLGNELDIHCGGVDHINIHHTNEIAQSEAATGKKFFNYWLHGAFLNIAGGKKMAKSEGNFLTLQSAIIDKGFNPRAYRYAALSVHYRKPMEYSEEGIQAAQNGLNNLIRQIADLGEELSTPDDNFDAEFIAMINDDMNMPGAMAVTQKVLKSDLPNPTKLSTIARFDRVLGLRLLPQAKELREAENAPIPEEVANLLSQREEARKTQNWAKSDALRTQIESLGYTIKDTPEGQRVTPRN